MAGAVAQGVFAFQGIDRIAGPPGNVLIPARAKKDPEDLFGRRGISLVVICGKPKRLFGACR